MSHGAIVTGMDGSGSATAAVRQAAELAASGRRGAFLNTVRAVIDAHGQKVSAVDRLHLIADTPMLVVWGTHDRVIRVEHTELVRDMLPRAGIVLLDGIGHTPHPSQPAYVGGRLAAWVRSTSATPAHDRVAWKVERPTSHA